MPCEDINSSISYMVCINEEGQVGRNVLKHAKSLTKVKHFCCVWRKTSVYCSYWLSFNV